MMLAALPCRSSLLSCNGDSIVHVGMPMCPDATYQLWRSVHNTSTCCFPILQAAQCAGTARHGPRLRAAAVSLVQAADSSVQGVAGSFPVHAPARHSRGCKKLACGGIVALLWL